MKKKYLLVFVLLITLLTSCAAQDLGVIPEEYTGNPMVVLDATDSQVLITIRESELIEDDYDSYLKILDHLFVNGKIYGSYAEVSLGSICRETGEWAASIMDWYNEGYDKAEFVISEDSIIGPFDRILNLEMTESGPVFLAETDDGYVIGINGGELRPFPDWQPDEIPVFEPVNSGRGVILYWDDYATDELPRWMSVGAVRPEDWGAVYNHYTWLHDYSAEPFAEQQEDGFYIDGMGPFEQITDPVLNHDGSVYGFFGHEPNGASWWITGNEKIGPLDYSFYTCTRQCFPQVDKTLVQLVTEDKNPLVLWGNDFRVDGELDRFTLAENGKDWVMMIRDAQGEFRLYHSGQLVEGTFGECDTLAISPNGKTIAFDQESSLVVIEKGKGPVTSPYWFVSLASQPFSADSDVLSFAYWEEGDDDNCHIQVGDTLWGPYPLSLDNISHNYIPAGEDGRTPVIASWDRVFFGNEQINTIYDAAIVDRSASGEVLIYGNDEAGLWGYWIVKNGDVLPGLFVYSDQWGTELVAVVTVEDGVVYYRRSR